MDQCRIHANQNKAKMSIKVNGIRNKDVAQALTILKTVMSISAIGKMIKWKDKAVQSIVMVVIMKANLKIMKETDKEL